MNKAALFIQDQGSDMPQLLAPLAVSLMIFVCTFAAAISGMVLRKKLPDDHVSEDSKDVIKLVMGLIATMAASWSLVCSLPRRTAPTRRKAVN
jgi:amino acid transporter